MFLSFLFWFYGSYISLLFPELSNLHYVLYWDSDSTTKLDSAITEIAKTGSNLTYTISANTSIPSGATHFLVFTKNDYGEMATGVSVEIDDLLQVAYIAGYTRNSSNIRVPCYWQNGIRTDLSVIDNTRSGYVNSIYVNPLEYNSPQLAA